MPRPTYTKREASEWNTREAIDNAEQQLTAWATKTDDVPRAQAGAEFAQLWHDLINDEEHPISYKMLAYTMYRVFLSEE